MTEIMQIARIIDPWAWADLDNLSPTERSIREHNRPLRQDMAIEKAREIIATLAVSRADREEQV